MVKVFKNHWNQFWIAVGFLTRLPIPKHITFSQQGLNNAAIYFPVIGAFLGLLQAALIYFASSSFSIELSVIISMIVLVIVTGAFHEDGLADSADGFGGGWSSAQILAIMKDSRLGTYGVLTLILSLLLKWQIIVDLEKSFAPQPVLIFSIFIIAASLSRANAVLMMGVLPYCQLDQESKVKPIVQQFSALNISIVVVMKLLVIFGAVYFLSSTFLWLIPLQLTILYLARRYFNHRLSGYTGDALGALQQVNELLIYLVLLLLII